MNRKLVDVSRHKIENAINAAVGEHSITRHMNYAAYVSTLGEQIERGADEIYLRTFRNNQTHPEGWQSIDERFDNKLKGLASILKEVELRGQAEGRRLFGTTFSGRENEINQWCRLTIELAETREPLTPKPDLSRNWHIYEIIVWWYRMFGEYPRPAKRGRPKERPSFALVTDITESVSNLLNQSNIKRENLKKLIEDIANSQS